MLIFNYPFINMKKAFIFLLFSVIFIISCTVQKRQYRNGYNLSFKNHINHRDTKTTAKTITSKPAIQASDSISSQPNLITTITTKKNNLFTNKSRTKKDLKKRFSEVKTPNYEKTTRFSTPKIANKHFFHLNSVSEKFEGDDKYDVFSIAAFICAILGLFLFFPSIAAIIFGIISNFRINNSYGLKGKNLATASIIIGVFTILLYIAIIFLIIILAL